MDALICSVVCAATVGFMLAGGDERVGRRLAALTSSRDAVAPKTGGRDRAASRTGDRKESAKNGGRVGTGRREVVRRRGVAVLAGVACALLVGGPAGLVAGGLAAVACERVLARLEPAEVRRRRVRLAADLPIAVELLGACLRGGTSWAEAVDAVAGAVGGPLGEQFGRVAAQVRLGADPATAWLALADDPLLAPLARTVARTADSGASLAPVLVRLAQDQRRVARAAALARARSAGIRAVAPLGLCFLPAFVLLGIVPAIAGIAATLQLP
jgi:Flp pilus assembly protein TadB